MLQMNGLSAVRSHHSAIPCQKYRYLMCAVKSISGQLNVRHITRSVKLKVSIRSLVKYEPVNSVLCMLKGDF